MKKLFSILWMFTALPAIGQMSAIRNPLLVGARPMAMGETFTAVADDANSIYWNPAGIAYIERYEFQFMHADLYNTGIKNKYFASLMPGFFFLPHSKLFSFGFDWFNLGYNDTELDFSQNDFSFTIGIRLHSRISIGGKIKYLTTSASLEDVIQGKGSGIGIDLGALFYLTQRLKAAIVTHDWHDTELRYENGVKEILFRENIRYGLSYTFNDFLLFNRPLLALDFDDRIHLGAEIWLRNTLALRAGLQHDCYKNSEDELIFSFGAGVRYKVFRFDYALTNSPFLENTNRISLGLCFNLPSSPVKIASVEVRDIYASQYIFHETDTCAVIDIKCEGADAVSGKIEFQENRYGISAEKPFKIDPHIEAKKQIVLFPTLTDKLWETSQSEGNWTYARIFLEPKSVFGTKREESISPAFKIYPAGSIDWGLGTKQAAAFITPHNSLVDQVASEAQTILNNQPDNVFINKNASLATYIFNILSCYGIRYRLDPNTPFGQVQRELDTIQYPQQLLLKKQGDCDDTTILYAAILENLGIRTALVDVPRHIFMMFDTGVHQRQQLMLCLPDDQYVIYDQHVWLPVETTLYGESFADALKKGAEEFYQFDLNNDLKIVDVHYAWEKFRPFEPRVNAKELDLPAADEISNQYNTDLQRYANARNEFLEQNYYTPLRQNPNDISRLNELAYIYYLTGDDDKAFSTYLKILTGK